MKCNQTKEHCKPLSESLATSQNAGPAPGSFGEGLCQVFDTLPQDFDLRMKVSGELLEIIRNARNPTEVFKYSKRIEVPYLRLIQGGRST